MQSHSEKAHLIFERMALSEDDVVAERTIDIAYDQLTQSATFFRERADEGFFDEQSASKARDIATANERLAAAIMDDPQKELEFNGETMPAYIATAHHLDRIAEVLRGMQLYPEWNEYYDDMARKLNEYANGLRLDPDSSFRAI